ncbi:DUF6879 family protein [Dactylosporangium sucinum]|uniref:DUF6879 domain-containing protein n=1 Tax=Dactylosporangium sucinum TaxID=1424081 RepID=A0A917UG31_9ACTN|nr:DUF6879 family protein [Dactylosporangium sucinum]GGM90312.1 hypothetical protein GCM10007977_110420 [Dactylosporangium sucinum]
MLTDEEFYALFRDFKRTAFHLEMRDKYGLDSEEGPFQRFMRGEPDDYAWHAPWLKIVRDVTTAGKEISRARIVTVPHSDYTRWSLANAPLNIEAGEDVRWLPRHEVGNIELPPQDFWLFDDERVVWTPFDADGRFLGSFEERDPRLISQCRSAYEGVWAIAIPHRDYV